jgi:hypothetical protein
MEDLPRTRREAKQIGGQFYFTGIPCKHNHVDRRRTVSGDCDTCYHLPTRRNSRRQAVRDCYHKAGGYKAQRVYNARHPNRAMLIRVKSRAKKEGTPFNLELSDIVIPTHCPILGTPLSLPQADDNRASGRGPNWNSASLDKINPSLGYVKGNVQVISNLANTMKSMATKDQLLTFAAWVLKTFAP